MGHGAAMRGDGYWRVPARGNLARFCRFTAQIEFAENIMAYPGDWDERVERPPPLLKTRLATARNLRSQHPTPSLPMAVFGIGTLFVALLAIGMAAAALFAPGKGSSSLPVAEAVNVSTFGR